MDKRRLALAAIVVPLLAYPVLLTIGLAIDLLRGEGTSLYYWVSHSKGHVWRLFWGDWGHASLQSYPIVLPLMLAAIALLGFLRRRGH